MTTREELFEIFDEITEKAFQIMEGKNSDYASDEDSLANFRSSEVLNVDSRKALLIRILDKIKRQVNYIERGELSVDSAEDDIVDLINYSVLLHALNREEENKTGLCGCKTDTNEYILLEDISGLGKKGDVLEIPSHYRFWEYIDDNGDFRSINLENDDGIILKDTYEWLEENKIELCDCNNLETCVENNQCLKNTSIPIHHDGYGYIVDHIIERKRGYEVQCGDKGKIIKHEDIKGVYGDDRKISKIELGNNVIYKTKELKEKGRSFGI